MSYTSTHTLPPIFGPIRGVLLKNTGTREESFVRPSETVDVFKSRILLPYLKTQNKVTTSYSHVSVVILLTTRSAYRTDVVGHCTRTPTGPLPRLAVSGFKSYSVSVIYPVSSFKYSVFHWTLNGQWRLGREMLYRHKSRTNPTFPVVQKIPQCRIYRYKRLIFRYTICFTVSCPVPLVSSWHKPLSIHETRPVVFELCQT